MNPGFLKLMVVEQLLREPVSGYAMVKNIQEKTGWKPSWGSIYPLLSHFEKDGHVAVKQEGKRKTYTVTPVGRQMFGEMLQVRTQAHQQIVEQLKLLASLGDEHCEFALRMLEMTHSGKPSIAEIPEALQVREEMYRLSKDGKVTTNTKQIRAILGKTLAELKKL